MKGSMRAYRCDRLLCPDRQALQVTTRRQRIAEQVPAQADGDCAVVKVSTCLVRSDAACRHQGNLREWATDVVEIVQSADRSDRGHLNGGDTTLPCREDLGGRQGPGDEWDPTPLGSLDESRAKHLTDHECGAGVDGLVDLYLGTDGAYSNQKIT